MQRQITLPPFENLGAGLRGIITRIPQGEVIDEIVLKLGGTTFNETHLNAIRIKLGGKTVRTYTGTKLRRRNEHNGIKHVPGFLSIPFADINAKTRDGKDMSSLNTRNFEYAGFSIEVEVDATALAPTLEGFYLAGDGHIITKADQLTAGSFMANLEASYNVSGAGEYVWDLPTGGNASNLIRQIQFHDASSAITHIEILKDSIPVLDKRSVAELAYLADRTNQRVSQATMPVYDAVLSNVQGDALDLRRKDGRPAAMQFKVTTSAACQIDVSVEMLASVGSI